MRGEAFATYIVTTKADHTPYIHTYIHIYIRTVMLGLSDTVCSQNTCWITQVAG